MWAAEAWEITLNIFQRHSLLNKVKDWGGFYTLIRKYGERVLAFIDGVRDLASVLKMMGVEIDDDKIAMNMLNGLLEEFEYIITT